MVGQGGDKRRDRGVPVVRLQVAESGLLNSFRSRDVAQWQQLLDTREAGELLRARGSKFRDKIFREIKSANMSDCSETALGQIRTMMQGLLQTSLKSDPRIAISVERCVIACQARTPHDAVELAREALLAEIEFNPLTLTSTISKAVKLASNPYDLARALGLAQQAAASAALSTMDGRTVNSFNVIIAVMCDPVACTMVGASRVGAYYQPEPSLLDVAERVKVGAGFAELVVAHGIPFNDRQCESRINFALRGIVTAAMALFLKGARSNGEISNGQWASTAKWWGLLEIYPRLTHNEDLCPQWRDTSSHLLYKALEVAKGCFGMSPDGAIVPRYQLRGETLARLVYALEESRTELSEERKDTLTELLYGGLGLPECRQEISWRCMHTVLRLLNSPDSQPVRRAERVALLLRGGLDKVRCIDLLEQMSEVLGIALEADPELEDLFLPLGEQIVNRIGDLKAQRVHSTEPPVDPRAAEANQGSSGWFSQLLGSRERKS